MKNTQKILIILSPLLAAIISGIIQSRISEDPGNMAVGFALGVVIFLGIPFVAITGLIISFISRNSVNSDKKSLLGYLIPAVITWIYAFFAALN